MTTLAIMKARITTEMRRTNIAAEIADAIGTAIAAYQVERYKFTEKRITFNTAAGQEFYSPTSTPAAIADVANLVKIDYVKYVQSGSLPWTVTFMPPERMETLNAAGTNTGSPLAFCYYAEQIRFYPIPNDVYPIVMGCQKMIAAPATDAETGNPWMTQAERLIRSRAKWELAMHRTFDNDLATRMSAAIEEAKSALKGHANSVGEQSGWAVTPTSF